LAHQARKEDLLLRSGYLLDQVKGSNGAAESDRKFGME